MPRKNLTARWIAAVKPPTAGQIEYWDISLPGFGLRVAAGGRKAYVVMYRHGKRKRRYTLGTHPSLPLAEARERARDVLRDASKGADPAAMKKADRSAGAFKELAGEYIERYAKVEKRSWRTDKRILDQDVVPILGAYRPQNIRRRDIVKVLDRIVDRGAPVQANRTLEILRKLYNWAIARDDTLTINPCAGIDKPGGESERERVLTDEEIRDLWHRLDGARMTHQIRQALRLLLILGQRKAEVAGIARVEIDRDAAVWTIPPGRAKSGKPHVVPLPVMAIELIDELYKRYPDSRWLFPSPRGAGPITAHAIDYALRANADMIQIDNIRPHDLRRTMATNLGKIGVARFTISEVLGHTQPGPKATAVYDRHRYVDEKRAALDAWNDHLAKLITGERRRHQRS